MWMRFSYMGKKVCVIVLYVILGELRKGVDRKVTEKWERKVLVKMS